MSGGSWGSIKGTEEGTVSCHPSAWCKVQQGRVDVRASKGTQTIWLNDVKATKGSKLFPTIKANRLGAVYRLWSNGDEQSKEYFLIESRMKYGFDASLPGEGLLIWRIDDTIDDNKDLNRFKVTLLNADFKTSGKPVSHLGYVDGKGCPFPGSSKDQTFNATSMPSSQSHNHHDTFISITNISEAGRTMRMDVSVQPPPKAKL